MNYEGLTESVSAAIGAGAVVGTAMRRYWRKREERQQAEFTAAVEKIVDAKLADARTQIIREIRSNRRR